ncbi:MAG TPA: PAS domain S-box protein [Ignavibacteria bacterium]
MNFTRGGLQEKNISESETLNRNSDKFFGNNSNGLSKITLLSLFGKKYEESEKHTALNEALWIFIIFAVYFLSGKLGLSLAYENESASAVWAPTGIALAVLILRGYYLWPVIFVGALLVNFTTTGFIPTSLFIAIGNTLEGLLGAYLVNKYANGKCAFEKVQNIFNFVFLAGILSTLISATIGVTSLAIFGLAEWSKYFSVWLTWWLGDAIGAFLIAPLLILWAVDKPLKMDNKKILEAVCVVLTLVLISVIEFTPFSFAATHNYPFSYIIIPPFVWIALRFSKRFIITAAFSMCAIAIWGTLNGYGPFVVSSPNESLVFLQIFICIITVMSISFSSVISERNKNEKAVKDSERQLRDFVDNASLGLHWIDKDGKIIWANKHELELLGYNKKEYIGRHISEIHVDPVKINDMLTRLKNKESIHNYEAQLKCKDGSVRDVLISSNVYWEGGKFIHTRCFTRDITERKRLQLELEAQQDAMHEAEKRSRMEFQRLLEKMPAGTYTCDAEGLITYYNERAAEMWGRAPKLNDPADRYSGSDKLYVNGQPVKREQCWMALALKEDEEFVGKEIVIERPDRSRLTVLAHANPIHDENGKLAGAVNVLVDITDRKRLETALRESEQRFYGIFKQAAVGIAQFDLTGKFVLVNDRYCEIIGRPANELINMHMQEITHPEDLPHNMELYEKLISDGKDFMIDKRYLRPDNSIVWVRKSVALIQDKNSNSQYIAAICTDITEQKRAEEALLRSEEKFRSLFDLSGACQAVADPKTGKLLMVNQRLCDFLGYTREELKEKTFIDISHPDDITKTREYYKKLLKGDFPEYTMEKRYIRKDGSVVWGEITASVMRSSDRNIIYSFAIIQDITARKIAEKHLNIQYSISKALAESKTFKEASQKVLQSICEGLNWELGMIWLVDKKSKLLRYENQWHKQDHMIEISGMIDPERTFKKGIGLPGRVWDLNKPAWIPDVTMDNNFPRAAFAHKACLHAGFAFPIRSGSDVIAIIECFNKKIIEPLPDLLKVLNASGRQIGNNLVRMHAEEEREIAQSTYKSLFDNTLDGILILDENGTYLNVNDSFCRMLKTSPEKLIGQNFSKFMPSQLFEESIKAFGDLKTKGYFRGEFPLMAADGSLVDVDWVSKANFLPGMHFCVARDITDRKISERKLNAEYSFRKAVEDSIAAGIAAVNEEGIQTYVNPSLCKMLGWAEEKLVGAKPPFVYWPPEEIENIKDAFEKTLCDNVPKEGFELKFCRKNGERFDALVMVNRIKSNDDTPAGWLASVTDITEIKKVQTALKEAHDKMEDRVRDRTIELNMLIDDLQNEITERRRAEEKLRLTYEKLREAQAELIHSEKLASLGRFSSGIAHEIRNPLANISALAQLLNKQKIEPALKKHLKYIMVNSNIANNIIEDLLNFASPHNVNFKKTSIDKIINDLYEIVNIRCAKNKIKLTKSIDTGLQTIMANEEKLQTAFLNFISNSIDAMPGGGDLYITAKIDNERKEAVISFKDTGAGIPKENLDKILEPFFTTKNNGTGLGLSMAYHVIRAHSGKIYFESELNKGTNILIRLPVAKD